MNSEVEFIKFLRTFSTKKLIMFFFQLSVQATNNKPTYTVHAPSGDVFQWELVEILFYSIKYGNDFRNKLITERDFIKLINLYRKFKEDSEKVDNLKEDELYKHLVCISNEQFDFQAPFITTHFNRLYYILVEMDNRFDIASYRGYLNLNSEFKNITNLDFSKYIKVYFFILIALKVTNTLSINQLLENIKFDTSIMGFQDSDISYVSSLLAKNYSYFKEQKNWGVLRYNPLIIPKSECDDILITNYTALQNHFSSSIYWTIRNHHQLINSYAFNNHFGDRFEFYLKEVFDEFNVNAEKISETKASAPDWKIESTEYVLVIEQKSSLYPLDSKSTTIENRIDSVTNYWERTLTKAFSQLNNYGIKTNKKVIRICLTFDKIYMDRMVRDICLSKVEAVCDKSLYWIMHIADFEKLIYLMIQNEAKFNKMIEHKIQYDSQLFSNLVSLEKLLEEVPNVFLEKRNYYKKITDEMTEKLRAYKTKGS